MNQPTQPQACGDQPHSPAEQPERVQLVGVRRDGAEEVLGTIPMPATMKAKDIVRGMFGAFEVGDDSDADLAYACCEEVIKHMQACAGPLVAKFTPSDAEALRRQGVQAGAVELVPTGPAEVVIDFAQVGTAGPFPVVNGRVVLPDVTMLDLARMLRPTVQALAEPPILAEADDLEGDARQAHDQCRAVVYMAEALASVYRAHASLLQGGHMAHEIAGPRGAAAMEWLGDALNGMDAVADGDTWMADIFARAQARWAAARTITLTLEQARTLAEALDIGQDAAGAEATQFHEGMAGYVPAEHERWDRDVAKVKAAGALLGQLIQGPGGAKKRDMTGLVSDGQGGHWGGRA